MMIIILSQGICQEENRFAVNFYLFTQYRTVLDTIQNTNSIFKMINIEDKQAQDLIYQF